MANFEAKLARDGYANANLAELDVLKKKEDKRWATVKGQAAPMFNGERDAIALEAAISCDKKTVIEIIGNRNTAQLKTVEENYKVCFGKDLQKRLKKLSGDFEKLCIARFYDTAELNAKCLREAMKGNGTDERALIDVILTATNQDIADMKEAFKRMYQRDLENDVHSETSGSFRKILVSALQGKREEKVDLDKVEEEAEELYKAGEGRFWTDSDTFNRIFSMRSRTHLREVFQAYTRLPKGKKDIHKAIKSKMSGDTEKAFLTLTEHTQDPLQFWAKVLYKSMEGLGTDERTLTRTVALHCESDLAAIKQKYHELCVNKTFKAKDKTLAAWIHGDTGSHYRAMLLTLIGEPNYEKK